MNRTIAFDSTDELILKNLRHDLGLRNFTKLTLFHAFLATLAVLIAFAFGSGGGRTEYVTVTAVAVLLVLLGLWYWWGFAQARKSALAGWGKLPDRKQTYTFTDDKLLVVGPVGHSELPWDLLEAVERFTDLWRLKFFSGAHVLPAEVVDEEIALFIETKALDRGIAILVDGKPARATAQAAALGRSTGCGPLAICVIVGVVVYLWYSRELKGPVVETFVIKPGEARLIPLGVAPGDSFHVSVAVRSGLPVDVRLIPEAVGDKGGVRPPGGGAFETEQIRDLDREETWQHTGPAIIVVTSPGWSEVRVQYEIWPRR